MVVEQAFAVETDSRHTKRAALLGLRLARPDALDRGLDRCQLLAEARELALHLGHVFRHRVDAICHVAERPHANQHGHGEDAGHQIKPILDSRDRDPDLAKRPEFLYSHDTTIAIDDLRTQDQSLVANRRFSTAHDRSVAPVALLAWATTLALIASISCSVRLRSRGLMVISTATDFFPDPIAPPANTSNTATSLIN